MSVRYVEVGEVFEQVAPDSEVCMHLRVAGKKIPMEITQFGMVQLYDPDTRERFSFPVLAGEAGVYQEHEGTQRFYIVVPEEGA